MLVRHCLEILSKFVFDFVFCERRPRVTEPARHWRLGEQGRPRTSAQVGSYMPQTGSWPAALLLPVGVCISDGACKHPKEWVRQRTY